MWTVSVLYMFYYQFVAFEPPGRFESEIDPYDLMVVVMLFDLQNCFRSVT